MLPAYGSRKLKKMYGKAFSGTMRDTFLIDPAGTVVADWRKVSPKGHEAGVKSALLQKRG